MDCKEERKCKLMCSWKQQNKFSTAISVACILMASLKVQEDC